jgi:hypothetical protein
VVATHALTSSSPKVGVERDGTVYELFVNTLPSPAFTASDVLDLYLHRGSFETALADEDIEQDSDRWYSHTPCGQEFCQILALISCGTCDWSWGRRSPRQSYAPPNLPQHLRFLLLRKSSLHLLRSKHLWSPMALPNGPVLLLTFGFPGSAFTPQPDGTLRCPADRPLYSQERRPERDGSLRVLYAARISHCRSCPLRAQCQESSATIKPRRVSAVLWPLDSSLSASSPTFSEASQPLPLAPVMWKDWPRCGIRRVWLKVIRSQTVCLTESLATPVLSPATAPSEAVLTRAQRAHWRLSWDQRLTRNARPSEASPLTVTLHGLPAVFAQSFGFDLLATA